MERCWEKFGQYKDSGTTFNLKDHLWTLFQYEKGLFHPSDYPDDEYVYGGCNCGNCHPDNPFRTVQYMPAAAWRAR
jgi:hypothetical protein